MTIYIILNIIILIKIKNYNDKLVKIVLVIISHTCKLIIRKILFSRKSWNSGRGSKGFLFENPGNLGRG